MQEKRPEKLNDVSVAEVGNGEGFPHRCSTRADRGGRRRVDEAVRYDLALASGVLVRPCEISRMRDGGRRDVARMRWRHH
jgi:hypothetical protein